MARTRKMVNLAIEETSGVDHPAHLHEGWLVMKSADESEVQRVLDETLTEEDSNMEETTTAATEAQVEKAEMTMADAMKKIAELEGKLAEMEMSKETMPESDKTEDEMDYMKSAPESVVKMIESFKKQAETATAELQAERDSRADAESIEKAKGWSNISLDAEKVGPALRRLSSIDSDLAKAVEDVLTSINAQAESANIFAEIGKSADFKEGNAYGRMTAMAKSAVEDGVAKSFEQALSDVAIKNPELYSHLKLSGSVGSGSIFTIPIFSAVVPAAFQIEESPASTSSTPRYNASAFIQALKLMPAAATAGLDPATRRWNNGAVALSFRRF